MRQNLMPLCGTTKDENILFLNKYRLFPGRTPMPLRGTTKDENTGLFSKQKRLLCVLSLFLVIAFLGSGLFFVLCLANIPVCHASVEKAAVRPSSSSDILAVHAEEERQREAMETYKLGLEYSNSGQIDKAIQEYRKALKIDPNLAEAHLNLGWSYAIKKQDYEIALQETLEAIRLKPDLITAHRNLWWIYRLQKMYDKALETLKNIVQLEPDKAINYLNLGDAYVSDIKTFDLAVQSYQKGLELDPKSIYIHRKLGKAYEFQKKYDLAIAEYKKVLELDPTNAYTYLFLVVALGKAGKQKEIPPLMKKAYESISKNIPVPDRWDLKLLKFFEGEISEEDILKRGGLNPIHKCQALYYAGLKNIWEGNRARGIELLSDCRSMKIDALAEYEYVKTELEINREKVK